MNLRPCARIPRLTRVGLVAASLLAAAAPPAAATGQCDESEAEVYDNHPDYLPTYAAGTLGVVKPGLARSYLSIAYLYLSGSRLDEPLQKQVRTLWEDRSYSSDQSIEPEQPWLAARNKVPGVTPLKALSVYRSYWMNCLPDSLATAARTLGRLRGQTTPADLTSWVLAQDQVFKNCGNDPPTPIIPEALPATATPALRAERDYQIAAAYFYSGSFDEAATRFAAIAKNPASPWASLGVYLQARAHLRRALVNGAADGLDAARPLLEQLAQSPASGPVQQKAQRLLGLILFRQAPKQYLRQIVGELRQSGTNYAVRLGDYLRALDIMTDQYNEEEQQRTGLTPTDLGEVRAIDDLTDWILAFQGNLPGAKPVELKSPADEKKAVVDYILARYDKQKSLPWLLAALTWIPADHARLRELLGAAQKLPRSSPGYDTAVYTSLLLLVQSPAAADRQSLAMRLLAELKARQNDPPSSLRNQLMGWGLLRAKTLDEALLYGPRHVLGMVGCGILSQSATQAPPPVAKAPQHLAQLLSQFLSSEVPLTKLAALLDQPNLPSFLRAPLQDLLFARGLLLGETDPPARVLAERMEPLVLKRRPQLQSGLLAVHKAQTPEERRFAIGLLYLSDKAPGASELAAGTYESYPTYPAKDKLAPTLLPAPELAQGAAEHKALEKLGSPLAIAVRWTLEYGTLHPENPALPQVLFDINHKSRYAHETEWSKKAFQFMHKTYPNHPLTKKVKYWF